jgi:oligopeptide/dipeptide ABC transporter ATP-binding protein
MNNHPRAIPLLAVDRLKVHFPVRRGLFGKAAGTVKAVDDVSFAVERGEVFALVGESGCGKTTTAQAVLGLIKPTSGTIAIAAGAWRDNPVSWNGLTAKERRRLRRSVQVVFQDPYSSLDPRQTVRSILREPLVIHGPADATKQHARILDLLKAAGLAPEYLNRYSHEFSGGQRQRIGIARALATAPEFIIADEPVSALDVSIQAQIINLLSDLQKNLHLTMLFISHDLAVVRHIADRLAVMYLGRIMEMGSERQIFSAPLHPYTRLLLDSVPVPGLGRRTRGTAPADRTSPPASGCLFAPRCPYKTAECLELAPALIDRGNGHFVACVHPLE